MARQNKSMRRLRILRTKTQRALLVAAVVLSAVTLLRAADPWEVSELRERTFDIYQHLKPRPYGDYPVRVVDIDEASLAALGQWPWPRTRLAALVQRLHELGAAVVAFDVIFSEPDRTSPRRYASELDYGDAVDAGRAMSLLARLPDHDQAFATALEKVPVVLGFAAVAGANADRPPVKAGLAFAGAKPTAVLSPFRGAVSDLELLNKAATGIGAINLSARDTAGIVRRLPMLLSDGVKVYPALVVEALRVAQNKRSIVIRGTGASGDADTGNAALIDLRVGDFRVPLTSDGEMWVYFNHDRPQRYVSVKDVLDPAKEAQVRPSIDGQIVFVGASAAGLVDVRPTALGQIVPGVGIQAQVVEQILGQNFLTRPDWTKGLEVFATFILGASLTALLLLLGSQFSIVIGVFVLALVIGGSWFAFTNFGLLLDPVYPSVAAMCVYFAVEGVLYVATDNEKKFVRQAFGQYLAPELLAKLENAPQMMRLGGETREITVMFQDVRGFTSISESLSASELVEFLNTLLSPLSDAIQSELGTIDKYIGDSVMAFWNAPLDIADHPVRACRAALKMRAVMQSLNESDAFGFRARGWAEPLVKIGVGINTGIACVGNMGSERRFNYSALGDVVNTAARIESSSKVFGLDLLLSEDVARAAGGFAMLEAGELLLKGKARPTKLFALLGDEAMAASAGFQELSQQHARLLEAIAAADGLAAAQVLAQCRQLGGNKLAGLYDTFEEKLKTLAAAPAAHLAEAI
jgi:adenylate cyclase